MLDLGPAFFVIPRLSTSAPAAGSDVECAHFLLSSVVFKAFRTRPGETSRVWVIDRGKCPLLHTSWLPLPGRETKPASFRRWPA